MEQPSRQEFNKLKDACEEQRSEIQKLKEWLHFPPDIGPAEHITDHVLMKAKNKRKIEIQSHVMKSLIVTALLFLLGLFVIGAKQWILLQSH